MTSPVAPKPGPVGPTEIPVPPDGRVPSATRPPATRPPAGRSALPDRPGLPGPFKFSAAPTDITTQVFVVCGGLDDRVIGRA
ncbi:hypothetical protein GCM10009828_065210 [Actinoplanes couchii]|uniref:Uncharacterized protein n=1 Tax=Actinoplanes couchii TaxID=403638 RepID=A0ABQ3X2Z0_9ACTN|nr:hypothetical protein Aco03nite_012600 [Actinoplanes couchii]